MQNKYIKEWADDNTGYRRVKKKKFDTGLNNWSPAHFPVGTVALFESCMEKFNPETKSYPLVEYRVDKIICNGINSFVVLDESKWCEARKDLGSSINIAYCRKIVKRGDGPVLITEHRYPVLDKLEFWQDIKPIGAKNKYQIAYLNDWVRWAIRRDAVLRDLPNTLIDYEKIVGLLVQSLGVRSCYSLCISKKRLNRAFKKVLAKSFVDVRKEHHWHEELKFGILT